MTKEDVIKIGELLSKKKISWRTFSYISGIKHSDMKIFLLGKKQELSFWLNEINNYSSCIFYEKKYQEMMSNKKCFAFFNGDCVIFNDGSIFSKTFGIYKRVSVFMVKCSGSYFLHVSINRKNFRVQSLVADNFIYNPNKYYFTKAIDGDNTNCHYKNIEFVPNNRLYTINPLAHKERLDLFYSETALKYSQETPVSEIDEAIIDYFVNGNELKLYQLFFMKGYFKSQIKFLLKNSSQIDDEVEIDFNNPELAQNKLIELTNEVEECCPVGEYFGVKGIGEGIMFKCESNPDLIFKSKGEKHSVSKVKVLNSVDVEQIKSCNEFINSTVTENRLNQGITFLKENSFEVSPKSLGDFIRWVVVDVLKEESDTISENNIDEKRIKMLIATRCRVWFLNNF